MNFNWNTQYSPEYKVKYVLPHFFNFIGRGVVFTSIIYKYLTMSFPGLYAHSLQISAGETFWLIVGGLTLNSVSRKKVENEQTSTARLEGLLAFVIVVISLIAAPFLLSFFTDEPFKINYSMMFNMAITMRLFMYYSVLISDSTENDS